MARTQSAQCSPISALTLLLGFLVSGFLPGCGYTLQRESLAITADQSSLITGTSIQLHAMQSGSGQQPTDVTTAVVWSSSNSAVATVNPAGVLRGITRGTTTVTATLNGASAAITGTVTPAALACLTLTPATSGLFTRGTQQYTATATYTDKTTADVTAAAQWAVSPAGTAAFVSPGLLTATAPGSFTVTAAVGAISATAAGTASDAPLVSIAVTPQNPNLASGATQQFTATGSYADGTTADITKTVSWLISDSSLLDVDANGLATAHGNTAATVTLTAQLGSFQASTPIHIVSSMALAGLVVKPTSSSIAAGSAEQHIALATYSDGTIQDVTASVSWSVALTAAPLSLDSTGSVLTVNRTGVDTAVASGTRIVQASLGGVQAQSTVLVTSATATSLAIAASRDLIPVGATQPVQLVGHFSDGSTQDLTLTAHWQSSDASTASIDATGLVTALKPGAVELQASFSGLTASSIGFEVLAANLAAIGVVVPVPGALVGQRERLRLVGTYADGHTHDLTGLAAWSTADSTVYASDANGFFDALHPGATGVSVAAKGQSSTASLTAVAGRLTGIQIFADRSSFNLGTTQGFLAVGTYDLGNGQMTTADLTRDVVWTSLDPTILTIDASGQAKSGSVGTTAVTASFRGVSQTSAPIQVTAALS